MQIKEQQSRDSVRIVWNVMPSNKSEQAKAGVPQALHYTPLQQQQHSILEKHPPQCQSCKSYMNPYNRININKTSYTCCICKRQNKFSPNYLSNKQQYPPEISLNYSSFVITQVKQQIKRMGYIFLVDICVDQKQLRSIKTSILDLVNNLEDDYSVGLITFNKFANLYDLTSTISKIHSFSPHEEYEPLGLAKMLNINISQIGRNNSKFICNLQKCRKSFVQKIESLNKIKHGGYKHQKQARSIGSALSLAININQLHQNVSKIIFFCGGPCTIGPGKVIEQDYKMQMRSIKQQTPKLSKMAKQYYHKLANKAKGKLIPIDSFIFSVQQTGLFEMSELLTSTGGLLVQHEEFDSEVFRQSFRKAYHQQEQHPPFQVASCSSISIKFSEQIITTQNFIDKTQISNNQAIIILGDIDQSRTITIMYELSEASTDSEAYYIQFKTTYHYPQNLSVKFQRITTIRRLFADSIHDFVSGFDQGAALALLAKLSIKKALQSSAEVVRQWLDNTLCKWVARYAQYRSGDIQSFRLAENIKLFPQFIYNLRRNALIRRSGLSLDEYIYLVEIVKKQSVQKIILIIQPALLQYSLQHPQMHPVPLDQKFMKPETILVLDSFFNVVEWRGKTIQNSTESNNNQSLDYLTMSKLLKNIQNDIQNIKEQRFPVPHYYLTGRGHSKQRFIKSRLSLREHDQQQFSMSDEADVNTFTQKLIELVVNKRYL